jgi:hypothetical protein
MIELADADSRVVPPRVSPSARTCRASFSIDCRGACEERAWCAACGTTRRLHTRAAGALDQPRRHRRRDRYWTRSGRPVVVGSAAAADSCGCVVREAWRSASPAMQGMMQRTTLDSLVDLSEGKTSAALRQLARRRGVVRSGPVATESGQSLGVGSGPAVADHVSDAAGPGCSSRRIRRAPTPDAARSGQSGGRGTRAGVCR